MTQDFAKPSTTRKPGKSQKKNGHTDRPQARSEQAKSKRKSSATPAAEPVAPNNRKALFICTLLILLAAFGYGLYVLQSIPETHSIPQATKESDIKPTPTIAPKPSQPAEQRFNFYDLLPEHKVVAPKVDAYHFKEKSAPGEFYYIIQTGSFRNYQDAERQKAMIAFQGIKADIQSVTNAQGTTWHRVSTGPFYNRSKMNSALDKLVSIQIQPLVKKIKKSS